jgi:uncharacterized protein YciI
MVTDEFVLQKVQEGRRYTLVLLKAGPKAELAEPEVQTLRMAHVKYLFGLIEEGKLLVNGPLLDDPTFKGLSIYQSDNPEEVKAWVEKDPAVQAGYFTYELRVWFSVPKWGMPAYG